MIPLATRTSAAPRRMLVAVLLSACWEPSFPEWTDEDYKAAYVTVLQEATAHLHAGRSYAVEARPVLLYRDSLPRLRYAGLSMYPDEAIVGAAREAGFAARCGDMRRRCNPAADSAYLIVSEAIRASRREAHVVVGVWHGMGSRPPAAMIISVSRTRRGWLVARAEDADAQQLPW